MSAKIVVFLYYILPEISHARSDEIFLFKYMNYDKVSVRLSHLVQLHS